LTQRWIGIRKYFIMPSACNTIQQTSK
jgi:hypothetical protein